MTTINNIPNRLYSAKFKVLIPRWIVLIAGLGGILLSPAWAADTKNSPAKRIVIQAGKLLATPGKPPLVDQTIVVENGHIVSVTSGFSIPTAPENLSTEIIDLRQAFVLPGLMDVHVHLSMNPDQEESGGGAQMDTRNFVTAIENAKKTLMVGYTTVRNVGSDGWHLLTLRDAINRGSLTGPRIFTSGSAIHVGTDGGSGACFGVESCRRAVREQIEMGVDLIKIYATCSGSKTCGSQSAPPLFLQDELEAIVATARSRQLPVAAHAHGTAGINSALRAGVKSIEHGSFNDEQSHALLRQQNAFLVPTLSVEDNIRRDFVTAKGGMRNVMSNFMEQHPKRMLAAFKAGVRIAAGSDSGVVPHGNNARELEYYVEAGLTPNEAIVTATINAALLLGREKDLGRIEDGLLADIIAVNGDPLANISDLRNVIFVMKEGVIYRQDSLSRSSLGTVTSKKAE